MNLLSEQEIPIRDSHLRKLVNIGKTAAFLCLFTAFNAVAEKAIPPTAEPIHQQATQSKKITGTIVDELGEPVIGANVVEKGTTNGTVTDIDGNFSLSVSPKSTLVVSFIGYTPREVAVGSQSKLSIKLSEDTKALDEVIVVGYGVQKAETVTGSVSAIKGEKLAIAPTVNFSNSIAGRLPGLVAVTRSGEPGSDDATFRIRGANTLGDNSPLVVVDGVANRSMNRLNPNDIESITVLKDASAAIYGAQAANGVILVTTKRGNTSKPEVNVSYNEGWSSPTVIPDCLDAPSYLEMLNEIDHYAGNVPKYSTDEIQKYRDSDNRWLYPNTDWFGETFKNSAAQRTATASIRGGADKFNYYVSVGGNYQDGIYKKSANKYSQMNFRGNIDGKISDYVKIGFDISGIQENRHYPTRSADDIFVMLRRGKPNYPAYWPNGKNGPDIEYGNNPVVITTNQSGYNKKVNYTLESKASLDITVPWVKGLSLSLNYSFDKYILNQKKWETPWYLYSWDRASYDEGGQPVLVEGQKGFSSAQLTQKMEDKSRNLVNALINYDRRFGDHNMKVLVGMERIWGTGMNFDAFRKYFVSTALDEMFAGGDSEKDNGGSSDVNERLNYFGRINYDYKAKYLLEFLWRVDGSYIFPAGKRYGFFPGISAGWRISEEEFWKENLSFINYFKLRGSWGQTGNDRIDPYQYVSSYRFNKDNYTYVLNQNVENKILEELRIPNPNVTWEVANQSNVGFDGQMLDGKLTFSAEYFYNLRSDILWMRNASVPTSSGLTLPRENIGKVSNQGVEVQVGYSDKAGDLSYSVSLNGGFSKNKIKFWDETPGVPVYQQSTGHPMPSDPENDVLYYNAIGIFNDQAAVDGYPHWENARPGDVIFEDVNKDGKIDGLDRIRVDKTNLPRFTGGLNIDLDYKNFYATIFFQWATGAVRNNYYEMQGEVGNFLKEDIKDRWTEDHPNADKPRIWNRYSEYWRNQKNTYWLQNTDYLRLKNLEIGYNVPDKWLSKVWVKGLRIYVSGLNMFTLTGLKDFDPESDSATSYPLNRVYNVGANITF